MPLDARKQPLTLRLCGPRGFCAGVDRAIQIVVLALKKYGAPVYVRHEIVHNRYVVEGLQNRGAVFVEELDEIREIIDQTQQMLRQGTINAEQAGRAVAAEVGDLLFAAVNYARHLKTQPEIALTQTTDKFIRRFTEMEILAAEDGKDLDELNQLAGYITVQKPRQMVS